MRALQTIERPAARRQNFRHQVERDRLDRNLVTDIGLDVRQRLDVFLAAETDRVTFRAQARRAADAVHVIRGILRQVVIDDVADVRHVQAARRHVRGDQHGQVAGVKIFEHAQSLFLRHVARQGCGIEAVRDQRLFELVGDAPRVHEHHGAARVVALEERDEERQLLAHGRVVDRLAHPIDRYGVRFDLD